MPFVEKSNNAVKINAPEGISIHITSHGSDWLWAAFSLFAVFAVAHASLFLFKGKKSIAHVSALFSTAILSFTYFTLASDLGYTGIASEFSHAGTGIRQIFYARYIGWFLGWPSVLFLFKFLSNGSSLANFDAHQIASYALELGATEVYVLGLLIGSLIESTYKWGYFTFSTVSLLFGLTYINYSAFKSASLTLVAKLLLAFFDIVWILYPIAWGLSEGGNVIQPDSEHVFYGILDLIIFAFLPTLWIFLDKTPVENTAPAISAPAATHADSKELEPEVPRASGETAV